VEKEGMTGKCAEASQKEKEIIESGRKVICQLHDSF